MDTITKRYFEVPQDSRLHEVLKRYWMFMANDQSSWGKTFNTEMYKKRVKHAESVMQHGHLLIHRLGTDFKFWKVIRKGSNNTYDVAHGRDQRYEIHEREEHET